MKSELVFSQSYWFILLCLLVGVAYAWLLYSKKAEISRRNNLILSGIRAALVSIICFLLLNPLLRSNTVKSLKPILVLGLDTSNSIQIAGKEKITQLKERLTKFIDQIDNGQFEIEIRDLNGNAVSDLDSLKFDLKKSDFGRFFRNVNEEFEGRNLKKIIFISDGIANSGLSPLNKAYSFSIDAVGLGDSTVKKDVVLKGLRANRLAYLGNSFPLEVEIAAHLFKGQSSLVQVRHNSEVVSEQKVAFSNDDFFEIMHFDLPAKVAGKQRYQVSVSPLAGESNTQNNIKDIIIEIIDGKEKVLILAGSPHPDIKALRSILEKNELFDVSVKIAGIDQSAEILKSDYDLLILHQLPSKISAKNEVVSQLLSRLKPTFFILGNQTDLSLFNGMQEVLGISSQTNKTDLVQGLGNAMFKRFPVDEETLRLLAKLSPIISPFGDYRKNTHADVILFQQIGSIKTDRPLLALNTNVNRKTAVFTADGLWKWRLEEYENNEDHVFLDDLILKTVQLISVKENKDKLRVYPTQDVIDIDEYIIFQTEAYDDLYTRIEPVNVALEVSNKGSYKKLFSYQATKSNSTFEVSGLQAGVYNYKAEATILGKKQYAEGQFIVKEQDLEFVNTTADYNFLRTLAENNGGQFKTLANIADLNATLATGQYPSKLINTENLMGLINLKWLLPFIIFLAALEWGFRKYLGFY